MKLLIQFPTRARPDKFFEVLAMYKEFAEDWDNVWVHVVCNADDKTMNTSEVAAKLATYSNLAVTYCKPESKIAAVNWGVKDWMPPADIVLLASDDMLPRIKGYDNIIRQDMQKQFPDTDGVLWYNDGHKGNKLCSLSILGRKYFERFGYIYYPGYKSFFCDNEFAEKATQLGRVRYSDTCIIEHAHPDYHLCRTDPLYKYNLRYHGADKGLYAKRKQMAYPD